MNLHFVGVGSVGGLFAFFAKRALRVEGSQQFRSPGAALFRQSTVTLHMNRPLPASAVAPDGTAIITREQPDGQIEREPGFLVERSSSAPSSSSPIDVLVITLKSDTTLPVVKPLISRFRTANDPQGPSTVVFLQNGVGNDEQFLNHFFPNGPGAKPSSNTDSAVGRPFVLLNSNSHGTGRKEPLWIRHLGFNTFHFGLPPETARRVGGEQAMFDHLRDPSHVAPAGTQTLSDLIQLIGSEALAAPAVPQCVLEPSDKFTLRTLQKLVVNCCANAIGALYDVANGEVLDRPELNELRKRVTAECARVLRVRWQAEHPESKDVPPEISEAALHDAVFTLIDRNRINRVSMLQDIHSGRGSTEIDLINGTIATWGRKYGIATSLNDHLIVQVKEKAAQSRKSPKDSPTP